MFRRHLSLTLIFCLFWQSLTFAGVQVMLADETERHHAVMHFEAEVHHHDNEGQVSQDVDPQAGVQHLMSDASIFAPALLPAATHTLQTLGKVTLAELARQEASPPFLSGLERPPRTNF